MFLLVAIASALLLVALIGLTAIEARDDSAVAWMAVGVPALGSIATVCGGLAVAFMGGSDEAFYGAFNVGAFALVAGSAFVAVVAVRTGTVSRRSGGFLAAASILFVVGLAFWLSGPIVLGVTWAGFSVAWIGVGIDAMRRELRPETPGPQPIP